MRILLAASEVAPFAKTGGLADVAGSLPAALARLGHRPCVFTPYYSQVMRGAARVKEAARLFVPTGDGQKEAHVLEGRLPGGDVPVYFVARREFFGRGGLYGTGAYGYPDNLERYAFFCRATCVAARELELAPDVFHLNDWQTALTAAYLRHVYAGDPQLSGAAVVFTVHNLGYQGIFPPWKMPATGLPRARFNWRELEFYGQLNLLKGALVYSDAISTVSKRYAREIQTPEGGYGLDGVLRERSGRLFGIVNGLDYSVWDPARDRLLPARYGPGRPAGKERCSRALRRRMGLTAGKLPVLGMVSRLAEQKGLDVLIAAVPAIMDLPVQLAILGSGEDHFERALVDLADRYPGRLAVRLGYDEELAHLIEAGSCSYLMPSRYEPCGLNQLISLRYGAVPVVRETGGLADTISDRVNGFTFTEYSPEGLTAAVRRAVSAMSRRTAWKRMVEAGMREDWSWDRSAGEYVRLYELARAERGLPPAARPRRGRAPGRKRSRKKRAPAVRGGTGPRKKK
ncbi:MAG: glycogen synthase GlgA [Planctomycetota bacterium]|jgi:starch synthase